MNHNTNVYFTEESRESISQGDGPEVASEAAVCLRSSHLKGSALCTEYQLQHILYTTEADFMLITAEIFHCRNVA